MTEIQNIVASDEMLRLTSLIYSFNIMEIIGYRINSEKKQCTI